MPDQNWEENYRPSLIDHNADVTPNFKIWNETSLGQRHFTAMEVVFGCRNCHRGHDCPRAKPSGSQSPLADPPPSFLPPMAVRWRWHLGCLFLFLNREWHQHYDQTGVNSQYLTIWNCVRNLH